MTELGYMAFGGSGLDRAAALRGDAKTQSELYAKAKILPVWRGKPLIDPDGTLSAVDAGHPVLTNTALTVFLGIEGDQAIFAADISGWQPEQGAAPEPPLFLDPTEQQHPDLAPGRVFRELRAVMTGLTAREAELAAMSRAILQWHNSHRFCAACGHPSDVVQSGWQRSCPSCKAQHFPRTDPVVIMLITEGNSALIGRSPGWPQGMYSCLAGFVEPGETVEAAVRREVLEETGVKVGKVRYRASQPWPFPASLMLGCEGEAIGREITLDPAELEDALWISREDMVTVMSGAHPTIKPARRGAIAHFLIQNWLADCRD